MNQWKDILFVLIGVLENPDAPAPAKRQARAQLERMAALADQFVTEHMDQAHILVPVLTDPDAPEGRA